ncbi:MAG: FeoB small GTPase domain-containing protein, partial [Bacilli bacterium]
MNYGLIGNPNTGKTTLFNQLTGSYAYVGNWSGVTVEKKIGTLKQNKGQLTDLPGIFSLEPYSSDERVAIDFLLNDTYDGLVNIVDASQLTRSLRLTSQLIESGIPFVVGLNMTDVARKKGILIDSDALSRKLQQQVFPIIARNGYGCETLLKDGLQQSLRSTQTISYDLLLEQWLEKIQVHLKHSTVSTRFLAVQLLLSNPAVHEHIKQTHQNCTDIFALVNQCMNSFPEGEKGVRKQIETAREKWIDDVVSSVTVVEAASAKSLQDSWDRLATHPILGIPIFLGLLYFVFKLTFTWVGTPLSDVFDGWLTGPFTSFVESTLQAVGAEPFLMDLVLNG